MQRYPIIRRLITIATASSLALLAALVAIWVRSYGAHDRIVFSAPTDRLWDIRAYDGRIFVNVIHGWPGPQPLRWCGDRNPKAPGPLYMQTGSGEYPLGSTESRWFGFAVTNVYYQFALNAEGKGYVSDADGALPVRPMYFWREKRTEMFPVSYSKGLQWQSVYLGRFVVYAAVLAVAPAWRWALRPALVMIAGLAARRRKRAGLCSRCGYDLRATPLQCPECGMRVGLPAAA
ncbi:hypothetical protein [Humisphaera borealis]|uniref:Uncharacterized protein n=1 Tax=Humisphaera borealis TaxID=2807512 RepID=A0A7M2WUX5_9BACT|nr:hypothetical protein [Humisphaera borealis]QOV89002.1 hypothetical protein IPV69_22685 [Humisphaera borealis]